MNVGWRDGEMVWGWAISVQIRFGIGADLESGDGSLGVDSSYSYIVPGLSLSFCLWSFSLGSSVFVSPKNMSGAGLAIADRT